MKRLEIVAPVVREDEPCYSLREWVEQSPGYRGFHRYRIIKVIRNDRIAAYREDLGPANAFKTYEFVIPGGVMDERTGRIEILHTVAELRHLADQIKDPDFPQPEVEFGDIRKRYVDSVDLKLTRASKRRHFAADLRLRRN